MLATVLSWVGAGLILIGGLFCLIGVIGLLRFPDLLTRIHATGMIDSLGAAFVLIGLMLFAGWSLISLKLFFILILLQITAATAAHALARAVSHGGEDPDLPIYHQKAGSDV